MLRGAAIKPPACAVAYRTKCKHIHPLQISDGLLDHVSIVYQCIFKDIIELDFSNLYSIHTGYNTVNF